MTRQQHSIAQFQMTFKGADHRVLQTLQYRYEQALRDELIPALNQLFDQTTSEAEIIAIDQLNVDLGRISADISSKELTSIFLKQMESLLQKSIGNGGKSVKTIRGRTTEDTKQWIQDPASAKIETYPIAVRRRKELQHYLQHGHWSNATFPADFQDFIAELIKEQPAELINSLRNAVQVTGQKVFQRIWFQFNSKNLDALIALIISDAAVPLRNVLEELRYEGQKASNTVRKKAIDLLFALAFLSKPNESRTSIALSKFVKQELNIHQDFLKAILPKLHALESMSIELPNQKDEMSEAMVEANSDGLHGVNVGIVLLHPFLKSYFEESKLLDDHGKFVDTLAAEKAVGLLHYLATGKEEAAEYELAFQKIFCGLPLNHLLDGKIEISDAERSEANKMINAAIKYWEALGNSTIEGIRDGFFQRSGSFSYNNDEIELNVEKNTIDILLDKIPWNVALIKMPWLDKLIKVQWR